jgi:hypothetical protein
MNIVPTDGALGPRIGPKVFADVPSAAELASAKAEVSDARKGRAVFLLITVLLLGALVAAVAFAVVNTGSSQKRIDELTAANIKLIEDNKRVVDKAALDLKDLQDKNGKMAAAFGPYQSIATQESQVSQLQQQIRAKTDQSAYSGFVLTQRERAALDSTGAWLAPSLNGSSWKARVQENLTRQIADLQTLQQRVEVYTPPAGAGGCIDPRRC